MSYPSRPDSEMPPQPANPPGTAGPVPPFAPPGPAGSMPPPYGPPGTRWLAPPQPFAPPWPGSPLPPPPGGRQSRPVHWPLIVLAASTALVVLAVVAGMAYLGFRAYEAANPDYTYTVLRCERYAGKATVEFAITNETSRTRDARFVVEYLDQSGGRLGTDEIEVSAIKPQDTVRVLQNTDLPAQGVLASCEIRNARPS